VIGKLPWLGLLGTRQALPLEPRRRGRVRRSAGGGAGGCAQDLETTAGTALARLLPSVRLPTPAPATSDAALPDLEIGTAAEGATIKEGSFVSHDDRLLQIVDGVPQPVPIRAKGVSGIPAKHVRIIRGLIPIRDAVRAVLRAQEAGDPWQARQLRLRLAYARFVRLFGPINLTQVTETVDAETGAVRETHRYPNLAPFADDPDVWLVASIEEYDLETGAARMGPIFTDRVIHPPAPPIVETAADALTYPPTVSTRG